MPVTLPTLDSILAAAQREGNFEHLVLANAEGLVMASSVDGEATEDAAAFVTLFLDAFERAGASLGFERLDELTLLDGSRKRFVVRLIGGDEPLFLVARVGPRRRWRFVTNQLVRAIADARREDGP